MELMKAGQSLMPLLPNALRDQEKGDFSSFEIADKLLKYLKRHIHPLALRHHHQFVIGLTLPALNCPRFEPRTQAMTHLRQLINLVHIYQDKLLPGLARPEVIEAMRQRLGDPGVDLDDRGRPLQSSGKLKIAGQAKECLAWLPGTLEARFRGAVSALHRVDAWMGMGLYQGEKLATHLIDLLNDLLQGEQPFPDDEFIWELLDLVNSTEYRNLCPEELMKLVRWLPRRKRYWHSMFSVIASERNLDWSDQMWALMASEEINRGERVHAVRKAMADGRLRPDQVPPDYHP